MSLAYSAAISVQSVSPNVGAASWSDAIAAWSDGPHLDRPEPNAGALRGELERLVKIRGLDEVEPTERLLRLRERAVGGDDRAVLHPKRRRGRRRLERLAPEVRLAIGEQLRVREVLPHHGVRLRGRRWLGGGVGRFGVVDQDGVLHHALLGSMAGGPPALSSRRTPLRRFDNTRRPSHRFPSRSHFRHGDTPRPHVVVRPPADARESTAHACRGVPRTLGVPRRGPEG